MPVKQLLTTITAQELNEWQEFFEIEPWGYMADEMRLAKWLSTYHAAHSKKSLRRNIVDFLPDHPDFKFLRRKQLNTLFTKQSIDQLKSALLEIAAEPKKQGKRKK